MVYTVGLPLQYCLPARHWLNLTMVQEILGAEHLDGSYWTLQIELFFYVQMLFWYMLGQLRRIHWIIGGWLVLATVEGLCEKYHWHFSYWVRELMILRFIPFFAIGILFYRLHRYPAEWRLNLNDAAVRAAGHRRRRTPHLPAGGAGVLRDLALFVRGHLRFLDSRCSCSRVYLVCVVPCTRRSASW